MKTLFIGIILGFLLRILSIGYVDYKYVQRDNKCVEDHYPNHTNLMTCNKFKNAPLFEKILSYQPNVSCYFANETLKFFYCEE